MPPRLRVVDDIHRAPRPTGSSKAGNATEVSLWFLGFKDIDVDVHDPSCDGKFQVTSPCVRVSKQFSITEVILACNHLHPVFNAGISDLFRRTCSNEGSNISPEL